MTTLQQSMISPEQWAELDAIFESCEEARIAQLDPSQVDEENPLDDRAFYVLATGFMFLYRRAKDEQRNGGH